MNRRLRLALFLAALVAAGPMAPARVVDAARAAVSIAWFRSDRIASPKTQQSNTAIPSRAAARRGFNPHPAPVLSPALLPHSLFQRPPPLQN